MLTVYLDSSDYSNYAAIDRQPASIQQSFAELNSLLVAESWIAPVSMIHVVECAHKTSESRPYAVGRAAALKRFSRGTSIQWFVDLALRESMRVLNLRTDNSPIGKSDDWLPIELRPGDSLSIGMVKESFSKKMIEEGIHRSQRRRVERQLFKKGRPTPELRRMVAGMAESVRTTMHQQIPLSPAFFEGHAIEKYLLGEMSEREWNLEVRKCFGDVELIIGHYLDRFDQSGQVNFWLHRASEAIASVMEDTISKAISLGLSDSDMRRGARDISNRLDLRQKLLSIVWKYGQARLVDLGVTPERWKNEVVDSDVWALPGLDVYVETVKVFVREVLSSVSDPRKVKRGDSGDLLHCIYLPYVDLFRADGASVNRLSQSAPQYRGKLVSKLADLPTRIRDMSAAG
jgi:hypothetical protein